MAVTATQILGFLERNRVLRVTRHEIACHALASLRRGMFALIVGLRDEETGDTDLSDIFRRSLSEWLTVPLPFTNFHAAALDELGPSELVGIRWGADMRQSYDAARRSLDTLRGMTSPLRTQLGYLIRAATNENLQWRIYCHRSTTQYFASCATESGCQVSDATFIHSLREYRDAEPFDLLIKVGPLRSRGWGSFPGACLNAPRYRELVQVVWAGTGDEQGFGDDPLVTPWLGAFNFDEHEVGHTARSGARAEFATTPWTRTVVAHADQAPPDSGLLPVEPAADELHSFARMGRIHNPRRAMLLHIGDGLGVLYPSHAEVLLVTPGASIQDSIGRYALTEVGPRGRFLVWPDIGDVNLGVHLTAPGSFSARWKAELKKQFDWHPEGLLRELRGAGITLRNLRGCVEHWLQEATTVIHAPQQRRHFEILIDVLEMEKLERASGDKPTSVSPWWRAAWQEIAVSRGLAIQVGMQEQEIIGEEIDRVVLAVLPEVRNCAREGKAFRIAIPSGHSLDGSISFLPIREVESGFCVPESSLKTMIKLSDAEEWRA